MVVRAAAVEWRTEKEIDTGPTVEKLAKCRTEQRNIPAQNRNDQHGMV